MTWQQKEFCVHAACAAEAAMVTTARSELIAHLRRREGSGGGIELRLKMLELTPLPRTQAVPVGARAPG